MSTVLEFNELPEGSQVGVQTTDRGVISGLAASVAVPPTPPTPSTIGGLVTFLTVARASANRLLDASLAMVSAWVDGQPLYSSSFGGAGWHWQADFPAGDTTDDETSCRPTAWIATGFDGAAVRDLQGNQTAIAQLEWFVDRSVADNEGAGTALDPVRTSGEIVRRWGAASVPRFDRFEQFISVTFVNVPTSPVNFDVGIEPTTGFAIIGTPATFLAGIAITAVQAQVRTAGAEVPHAITGVGLDATCIGKLAIIRNSVDPSNIGATARILDDLGGGKVVTSPFGTEAIDFTVFYEVTPLVGDVVDVMTPMNLPVGRICVTGFSNLLFDFSPTGVFTTQWVRLDGGDEAAGGIEVNGCSAYMFRTILRNLHFDGFTHPSLNGHVLGGGGVDGFLYVSGGCFLGLYKSGALDGGIFVAPGGTLIFDTDTYLWNTQIGIFSSGLVSSFGAAFWNGAFTDRIQVIGTGLYQSAFSVPEWGTANAGYAWNVKSGGTVTYAAKPTINGTLGAGRETKIGGADVLYSAFPAGGAITAANLSKMVLQT